MLRRDFTPRRAAFVLPPLLLFATLLASCGGPDCWGADCGCEGLRECIVSCEKTGCEIGCSNTERECGALCGDDCLFECSQTQHCSSYSEDGSVLDCHNVSSCAADCGADCEYFADNASSVTVTVGPGSLVECRNVGDCDVECRGSCEVKLVQVGDFSVSCADGSGETGRDNATVTCD